MKGLETLVQEALQSVPEITPWELRERMTRAAPPLLLDIREPGEYEALHIPGSLHVPRGVLEAAADWGYDDTVPELAGARDEEIVVICRSGRRSALAARTLQDMGFTRVLSLKLGVRGWNDDESPLEDARGQPVDPDTAESLLRARVRPDQRRPKG